MPDAVSVAPAAGLRVVVTRPQDEAGPWLDGLRAAGLRPWALPLIAIAPLALPPQPLSPGLRAVMWVSGSAVRAYFASTPGPWPAGVRCWAPGPGTAAALRAQGVPADLIDQPAQDAAQFDSESLWAVVAGQLQAGDGLLVVRGRSETATALDAQGSSGRDWLLRQCEAAGARVATLAVYERRCPVWDAATRQVAATAAGDGSVWLFSSGEAAGHLQTLLPGQDWADTPAIATHPRIAEALQVVGFRHIRTVRPTLAAVRDALLGRSASAGA